MARHVTYPKDGIGVAENQHRTVGIKFQQLIELVIILKLLELDELLQHRDVVDTNLKPSNCL